MPDNPQSLQPSWFPLCDHRLVALHGRDAIAFAQAQTMNDVAALRDGQWQWNGWLTPKGRVVALFALARIDAQTVWLILADGDADTLAADLRRFVFRSKVVIDVPAHRRIDGRLRASDVASGNHWAGDPADAIELDVSGDIDGAHAGRSLRIATGAVHGDVATNPGSDADAWRRIDLEHGFPRLDASQRGQWTPQQLSLARLSAYSVKKGCYPGQEIVARTHFLGQAKRGLALVRSDSALASGAELRVGDQVLGTVVSAQDGHALAVLPLELPAQTHESPANGGASWATAPLRGGLAR